MTTLDRTNKCLFFFFTAVERVSVPVTFSKHGGRPSEVENVGALARFVAHSGVTVVVLLFFVISHVASRPPGVTERGSLSLPKGINSWRFSLLSQTHRFTIVPLLLQPPNFVDAPRRSAPSRNRSSSFD